MNIFKIILHYLIRFIVSWLHFFGIELSKFNRHQYGWLHIHNIDLVIDVWANTGQSISFYRSIFTNAVIHAFEPLPSAFLQLQRVYKDKDGISLYNNALWSADGISNINECDFNPSSSLLEMSPIHKEAFPYTAKSVTTEINIKTLDSYNFSGWNILIKIDTQWYEVEVIKWWGRTISNAKVVIIETSFCELYTKQPLFNDVYLAMLELWFSYAWAFDQLSNPIDWKILQQDAIFIK